ncbi:MAG: DUF433 domain-containing protein [Planctomycetes bacterium]|nr:DUF433 domain-containing protein [Planctomycetota bacterium]
MSLIIRAERIPLETGEDGVVRVCGTRVTLDTIVSAFQQGATAEEIAQQYPTVELSDVYAVIGFYLRRRPEVEEYLEERRQQSEAVRHQNESQLDVEGIRDRLLERRTAEH